MARKKQSLQQLNTEALEGDLEAAVLLADRSPGCMNVSEFIRRFVPADEFKSAFDTFCDAFVISREKACMETVEVPVVKEPTRGKA